MICHQLINNFLHATPVADKPKAADVRRSPEDLGRIPALDGLRALAIAAVLILHFSDGCELHLLAALPHAGPFLVKFALAGWCGVDLFFVLSGFLITGIRLDSKASPSDFRNFYMRRGPRIIARMGRPYHSI